MVPWSYDATNISTVKKGRTGQWVMPCVVLLPFSQWTKSKQEVSKYQEAKTQQEALNSTKRRRMA